MNTIGEGTYLTRKASHFLLCILLLAFCSNTFAQANGRPNEFRAGSGSTMTSHGFRSMFIALPASWIPHSDFPSFLYIHENLTLLEVRRRLDFAVGMSPMFRFEIGQEFPRLLLEAGVGVNYISTRVVDGRQLGSHFLFSPAVSGGFEIPLTKGLLGIFYTFRHLSNAGFYEDNDGVNFQYIVFSLDLNSF